MTEHEATRCKAFFRTHYGDDVIAWLIELTGEDELRIDEALANRIKKDNDGKAIAGSVYAESMNFKTAFKHRNCRNMAHYFGCECSGNPYRCPHSRCFEVVVPITDKATGRLVAFDHGGALCKKAAATFEADSRQPEATLDKRIEAFA